MMDNFLRDLPMWIGIAVLMAFGIGAALVSILWVIFG